MLSGAVIKSPDDLQPFLEAHIDPERFFWIITLTVPHAIVRGETTSLRQASVILGELCQPAQIATAIIQLTKWMVERPHLSGKREGFFPVQKTLSPPLVRYFMDHRDPLCEKMFPEPYHFKRLMKMLRRDGVTIHVEAKTRMWMQ